MHLFDSQVRASSLAPAAGRPSGRGGRSEPYRCCCPPEKTVPPRRPAPLLGASGGARGRSSGWRQLYTRTGAAPLIWVWSGRASKSRLRRTADDGAVAVHWRSLGLARGYIGALLTSVLLCGCRGVIRGRQRGRAGYGSANIRGGSERIRARIFCLSRSGLSRTTTA
eukprot:COSAG03_NODE_2014_length_3211_cov_464.371787_3_plen_167_part_00